MSFAWDRVVRPLRDEDNFVGGLRGQMRGEVRVLAREVLMDEKNPQTLPLAETIAEAKAKVIG
jgi:hypothetical protein